MPKILGGASGMHVVRAGFIALFMKFRDTNLITYVSYSWSLVFYDRRKYRYNSKIEPSSAIAPYMVGKMSMELCQLDMMAAKDANL